MFNRRSIPTLSRRKELVDCLTVPDGEKRRVSVGQAVKAMILNSLGFANRALYLSPVSFQDKPVERLIGEGIEAEQLNDDVLGPATITVSALPTRSASSAYLTTSPHSSRWRSATRC